MTQQLHTAFTSILAMPYFKNEAARSGVTINGHEDAIAIRFVSAGFTQVTPNDTIPKLKKEVLNDWIEADLSPDFLLEKTDKELKRPKDAHKIKRFKNMPLGSFICQPCGSHSFPDFLVRDFDGRFVPVEAKSGSKKDEGKDAKLKTDPITGAPMWNDNLPKHGAIYIYSNEVVNETTVAMGNDLITKEGLALSKKLIEDFKIMAEKYFLLFAEADKDLQRGFYTWFRQQHFQSGGWEKTDWFKHKHRNQCEANVLRFVK